MRNLLDVLEVRADEAAEAIIERHIAGHGCAIVTVTDESGRCAVVELRRKKSVAARLFGKSLAVQALRTR